LASTAHVGTGYGFPNNLQHRKCQLTKIIIQIWEYFLAYSTITSRQGGATCYQLTLVKNINSTHRVEGINSQFGLKGALEASKTAGKDNFPVTLKV
jgi:hypothetical protein